MTNSIDSAPTNGSRTASSITAEELTRYMRRGGAPRPWWHLPEDKPWMIGPAAPYDRLKRWRENQTNAFTPMPPLPRRACVLRHEAIRVYDAMAFAMRQGIVFDAHLTIVWRYLGAINEDHATELLTKFNHEAGKWLARGLKADTAYKRHDPRSFLPGTRHSYVAVHEWGDRQGFHTHELAFIPPAKLPAFRAWAESCLARLAGRSYIPAPTLKITGGGSLSDERRLWRCWYWFKYITKTTMPEAMVRFDGRLISVRDIFDLRPFHSAGAVDCAQMISISHNIGPKSQRLAGFVSKFHRGEFESLCDSSYLDEWRSERDWARAQAEERARQDEMTFTLMSLDT